MEMVCGFKKLKRQTLTRFFSVIFKRALLQKSACVFASALACFYR